MSKIQDKIVSIFESQLGIDRQHLYGKTFKQLELDEIDKVMLTICLEDEFDIIIDDEQMNNVKTLEELVLFVEQLLPSKERESQLS